MSVSRRVLALAAGLSLAAACDKRGGDVPPAGLPPAAPGAAATTPPAAHPTTAAAAGALPPGHPALPPGHPGTEGSAGGMEGEMPGGELDPTKILRGRIDTDPKLKDKVAPGDAVFVVARVDDGSERGGMILGVKRFDASRWPIEFQLDGRDAMAPGTKFEGKVLLSVRVDKDGDAMTKLPGDLYGTAHLTIPASDVKLTVDKVQQ